MLSIQPNPSMCRALHQALLEVRRRLVLLESPGGAILVIAVLRDVALLLALSLFRDYALPLAVSLLLLDVLLLPGVSLLLSVASFLMYFCEVDSLLASLLPMNRRTRHQPSVDAFDRL